MFISVGDAPEDIITSLQPEGWNYMINTLKFFDEKAVDVPAYKGVSVFEFEGLEIMWEWKNDKN